MAEHTLTYRGTVYPWHCDQMGHMNVMWYVGKFDEATWQLFAAAGITPSYLRAQRRGMVAVDQRLSYRGELYAGDVISIRSAIIELGTSSIRFVHEMQRDETGEHVATSMLKGVHIDTVARRSCPLPEELRVSARKVVVADPSPMGELAAAARIHGVTHMLTAGDTGRGRNPRSAQRHREGARVVERGLVSRSVRDVAHDCADGAGRGARDAAGVATRPVVGGRFAQREAHRADAGRRQSARGRDLSSATTASSSSSRSRHSTRPARSATASTRARSSTPSGCCRAQHVAAVPGEKMRDKSALQQEDRRSAVARISLVALLEFPAIFFSGTADRSADTVPQYSSIFFLIAASGSRPRPAA